MNQVPIRILHFEDDPDDAFIIERHLKSSSLMYDYKWVADRAAYIQQLTEYEPHIVLCDHSIPGYGSKEALATMRQMNINAAFILVSGVYEKVAVDMMLEGIDDYIMKDRLYRLQFAISKAFKLINTAAEKDRYLKLLERLEADLKTVIDNARIGYVILDDGFRVINYNERADEYYIKEFHKALEKGAVIFDYLAVESGRVERTRHEYHTILSGRHLSYEMPFAQPNGTVNWYFINAYPVYDQKSIVGIIIATEDITARKKEELERERMTADLMQHNKSLEQFTYIISHNMRSPVANILGLTSLLTLPELSREDFRKGVEGLRTSAAKLDEILIDLNYILKKRSVIRETKEQVNFEALLEDVLVVIPHLAENNDVTINREFGVRTFHTVKSYIHSIFLNLLTNSIKYRKPTQSLTITIKSYLEKGRLHLLFSDDGMGLDLEAHGDKLFGLYKKFHNSAEGKGMGLYLVKTQVEMLGGSIEARSAPDQGMIMHMVFEL